MHTLKKTRIVHITSSSGGGTGKHIVDLLEGLNNLDEYDLVLVYSSDRADALFNEGLKRIKTKNIACIPYNVGREVNILSDIKAFIQLYKVIKNLKPDIIHLHAAKGAFFGRIAKVLGVSGKIIYNPHGGILHKFKEKMGFLFVILEKLFVRFTDKYIAVSKYIEKQLQNDLNIPNEKIFQIYNGIKFDESKRRNTNTGIESDMLNLLVVANFLEAKGHLNLIESIYTYIKSGKKFFNFIFLGEGVLLEKIQSKIKEYNLEDIISLKGFVLNASDYYNDCDAVIVPSLNDALPYAAIEAMYFAKPVFSTNVGGLPELVKEGITGHIFSIGNLKDMFDKLKYYHENRKQLQQLGKNGLTAISELISVDKMVAEVNYLYKSLLPDLVGKKDEITK